MSKKPVANSSLVLREEFDDWAVLFDPDTGDGFGLNPVCVYIWKRLDGVNDINDIKSGLLTDFSDVPPDVDQDIIEFITQLEEKGYVGYTVV